MPKIADHVIEDIKFSHIMCFKVASMKDLW